MSNIKNDAKIRNPLIVAIREQLEHRALWMYLLCDEAAKKGLVLNHRQLGLSLWGVCIVLMFDLAAAARSESLSWNQAWGRGSP